MYLYFVHCVLLRTRNLVYQPIFWHHLLNLHIALKIYVFNPQTVLNINEILNTNNEKPLQGS